MAGVEGGGPGGAAVLVFDVGGTRLRAALYDPAADALAAGPLERPTPSLRTLAGTAGDTLLARLLDAAAELGGRLCGDAAPAAVSVAFAGPVDADGRLLAAPTLWGEGRSHVLALRPGLEALWPGAPVLLLNDVSAAGYRHLRDDGGDFCIVTVSTGIGHKLFVGGRPVTGPHGRGGEIGHLRVDFSPAAPRCECGGRGHVGALASGTASAYQVRRLAAEDPAAFRRSAVGAAAAGVPERVENQALAAAFRAGDPWAAEVVGRMAEPLGRALAAIHLAAGVERFVVVGGFAISLGPAYLPLLAHAAAECAWDLGADWGAMLELGRADAHAELVGAGRFAARSPRVALAPVPEEACA